MHRIRRLVFFLGGVLIPPFSQSLLMSRNISLEDREAELVRFDLKLSLGQISLSEFQENLDRDRPTETKSEILRTSFSNVQCSPGIETILNNLKNDYEIKVIAESPSDLVSELLETTGLYKYINEEDLFLIDQHGPFENHHMLLKKIVDKKVLLKGTSLLIDHHSLRTSAAIRLGLDAAIFVDSLRLNRDLSALWGLY